MHGAYAIVCTTPIVILTLILIGIICWGVGILHAQWTWDRVNRECDLEGELTYNGKELKKLMNVLYQILDHVYKGDEIHPLLCGHRIIYRKLKRSDWKCSVCIEPHRFPAHERFDFSDVVPVAV